MHQYDPLSVAATILDLPEDAAPFTGVPPALAEALEGRGFTELTAVQRAVLPSTADGGLDHAALAAEDLQISSQTGSGKTVAIGLAVAPALLAESDPAAHAEAERLGRRLGKPKGPRCLILVPTRELAAQVRQELSWLYAGVPGARVDCVTGGTPVFADRSRLSKRPMILVGTPGRVLDHVTSGALDLGDVREFVLDEADQMLDMGFREDLESILNATGTAEVTPDAPEVAVQAAPEFDSSDVDALMDMDELDGVGEPSDWEVPRPTTEPVAKTARAHRTHLVSATFPRGIEELAARYQRSPRRIEGTEAGVGNTDIEHIGLRVDRDSRYGALVNVILLTGNERTLVFVNTRADCARLAAQLAEDGIPAAPLSGELAQSERTRTLNAFRAGKVSVLVATDVASRGLDVPEVTMVVHAMPATDPDVYVHRSGRTGRAGAKGQSVLLAPVNKERRLRHMLHDIGVDMDWRAIPTADTVRKAQRKRYRRGLFRQIDEPASETNQELAAKLIEERNPVDVIARLLDGVDAPAPLEPVEIRPPFERRGSYGNGNGQGGGNYRSNGNYRGNGRGNYQGNGRGGPRRYDGRR